MKYKILHLDENHSVNEITDSGNNPVVLGVPNAINFMPGDRFVIGSAVFEVIYRRFNISNMGSADLVVRKIGSTLSVQDGILGSTTRI